MRQALTLRDMHAGFSLADVLGVLPTALTALKVAGCVFNDDRGTGFCPYNFYDARDAGWCSTTRAWARLPRLRRLVMRASLSDLEESGTSSKIFDLHNDAYGDFSFRHALSGPTPACARALLLTAALCTDMMQDTPNNQPRAK